MNQQIYTIGHSNYSFEVFLNLLQTYNIKTLVDVRRFPGSRKFPHFSKDALEENLRLNKITYVHLPELGGRRKPLPDSKNTGLKNISFRGYADYMTTDEFKSGTNRLLDIASHSPTAMMCSEALWWSCHRSLISDYLKNKGYRVLHILNKSKLTEHPFTSAAKVMNGKLSYPQEDLFI